MPFERFHSRHKRSLLSPITAPLDITLRLFGFNDGVISTSIDLVNFTFSALIGQDVCPKKELSLWLIPDIIICPKNIFETTKAITCYLVQIAGKGGRELIVKTLKLSIKCVTNIFLPGLHTTLNLIKDKSGGLLPVEIIAMIKAFNMFYGVLKFVEIVPY